MIDRSSVISKAKPHETLINDIPQENQMMKKQSNENENAVGYVHMRTPPPEYNNGTRALSHHSSDEERKGKEKIKKRMPPLIDIESQQKVSNEKK